MANVAVRFKHIFLFLVIVFFLFPVFSQADYVDDLSRQIQEQEAKRLELEKKAAEYQQVINQKQGEIKSLSNQIAIFNAQIGKLETEIELTEDSISQTKSEIVKLSFGLGETELDISQKRFNLTGIIQTIAQYDQASEVEIILQSEDFSDFFNQMAYVKNLLSGVEREMVRLKSLKVQLSEDKETQESEKSKLEDLKQKLDGQKASLASQKKTKENLLKGTKGEESKYQKLLANIEAQKKTLLGDLNRLRQLKASELAKVREAQEKPPSQYWASNDWYFAQDDSRWAETNIGASESKMKNYGCAITSVAMVFKEKGIAINPGQLAKEDIFAWDLIYWPKSWSGVQCQNCPPVHTSTFDWFKLDRELGAGYPVIVFVKVKNSGAGHYVVVHHKTADDRYVVHDPLFGANIYLNSTQAYIGVLYGSETYLDQMVVYH